MDNLRGSSVITVVLRAERGWRESHLEETWQRKQGRTMNLLALKMEGDQELRNVGSLKKLEKSRKMILP